jgi:hypothetical protein
MYCKSMTRGLGGNVMNRILCFLIGICAASCGSALADITALDASGIVSGSLTSPYSGDVVSSYHGTGPINVSTPLSGSLSYDTDADGEDDTFASSEIGLWYAKTRVIVPDPYRTDIAHADGVSYFKVDSGQLSLAWNFEVGGESPYLDSFGSCFVHLIDWTTGPDWTNEVDILDLAPGTHDPPSGLQTVTLDPTHVYRLYWTLSASIPGAWWGPSDVWANLTFDLGPVQPVPLPGAAFLGILGLSVAGWRLRRTAS